MNEKDREIASILKKRLLEAVPLVDFRIFGSRARGDADEYSDLDVFIEVDHLSREIKEQIQDIAWEVGFENYSVISPLIFSRHEIENTPLRSSPIVKNVMEEGIVL